MQELKKILIISPYFPPFNTADMQRVRQMLPYLREFGWEPTIITVAEEYVQAYSRDPLLLKTFPDDFRIVRVKAVSQKLSRKIGIGSLSLRAFFSIRRAGDMLLRSESFDLVYFSTTAFHVMALGPRWKRKFKVPFVLDIQDPWYNKFYFENSLNKCTAKAWAFHQLDKYLEARTMPKADGITSVSPGYIDLYLRRYQNLKTHQFQELPFACAEVDFEVATTFVKETPLSLEPGKINVVYIGRGGKDMVAAATIFFKAVKLGLEEKPELFGNLKIWFVGTSYAAQGAGTKTFAPIAAHLGLAHQVTEITDRLPYFASLRSLELADMLFIPGSTDPTYTASKIYPYIFTNKPMLAIFHSSSSVCKVLSETTESKLITFKDKVDDADKLVNEAYEYIHNVLTGKIKDSGLITGKFESYLSRAMTKIQTQFFDKIA